MPLFKKTISDDATMGIWRMTETLSELEAMYKPRVGEIQTYSAFRNDSRRKEWLTVRILLAELVGPEAEILYLESGKPYIKDSALHISITHTIGYVAIRVSNRPVAIDIEYKANRVLNLIPRFVSEQEMQYVDPNDRVTTALIIWSAKETLYKLFDFTGASFDEDMRISNLKIEGPQGDFVGHFEKDGFSADVTLHFELQDDMILVYC